MMWALLQVASADYSFKGMLRYTYCKSFDISAANPRIQILLASSLQLAAGFKQLIAFLNFNEGDKLSRSYKYVNNNQINDWEEIGEADSTNFVYYDQKPFGILYDGTKNPGTQVSVCTSMFNTTDCPNMYITSNPGLSFEQLVPKEKIKAGETVCIVVLGVQSKISITNTLDPTDTLSHSQGMNTAFFNIPHGTTKSISSLLGSDHIDTFFKIKFGSGQTERKLSLSLTSYTNKKPKYYFTIGPDKTDTEPSDKPPQTQSPSASASASQSPSLSISPSASPSLSVSPTASPIPTSDPYYIINGEDEWEVQPGTIVRGDDIPEIKESHPPLQTHYVKPTVEPQVAQLNIGIGTFAILGIITFTVINVIRTYRVIKKKINGIVDEHTDPSYENALEPFEDSESCQYSSDNEVVKNSKKTGERTFSLSSFAIHGTGEDLHKSFVINWGE